jgi:hypothetical protein
MTRTQRRYLITILMIVITLLIFFRTVYADIVTTNTTVPATAKAGSSVPVKIEIKNTATPLVVSIVAVLDYIDESGIAQSVTASKDITIVHPISLTGIKVPSNSTAAKVDGTAKTISTANYLSIGKTLDDGQVCTVEYVVVVK